MSLWNMSIQAMPGKRGTANQYGISRIKLKLLS